MQQTTVDSITETGFRFVGRPANWLVGIAGSGPHATGRVWVRQLWDRFLAIADDLPGDLDRSVYVCPCHGRETEFTYYLGFTSQEPVDDLPDGVVCIELPTHIYGVGNISGSQDDVMRLYHDLPAWMAAQGKPSNREILWLERYPSPPSPIGERIDLEVWLPAG